MNTNKPYPWWEANRPLTTVAEVERLRREATRLYLVARSFIEQAEKVRGFPHAYEPYSGILIEARAAKTRAEER